LIQLIIEIIKKKREMEDKEIQYFTDGMKLVSNEFYFDAIHKFNMLIEEFPISDLAIDSLYNIGLCYFKMKQFEMAIETFQQVLAMYPEATISNLSNENIFGKTAAKCLYSILLSHLLMGHSKEALEISSQLTQFSEDTYIIVDDERITYAELADIVLKNFNP
jgi:tetratricopeptide (TPR) repeat protein